MKTKTPKIIYANGDSFVFGCELDPGAFTYSEYKRKKCYGGIIADELEVEYHNASETGASNQSIYRKIIQDIPKFLGKYAADEIFVLIGLTDCGCKEFYNDSTKEYFLYRPEKSILMSSHVELWNSLVPYNSVEYSTIYDYMMIIGIQNYLIRHRIPYLITRSYISRPNEQCFIKSDLRSNIYLNRYYDTPTFLEWVQDCPMGKKHPLEEGHEKWAKHLMSRINRRQLFDNKDLLNL